MRNALACLVVVLSAAAPAWGQAWAAKMFDHTQHDFGTVARGAKTEHTFTLKNLYEEDVHIASVRSSCGCTTPSVAKYDLKTFESTDIVAELNTRTFLGQKNVTLTVVFDRPFPGEVQLHVAGLIRGDVVLTPGSLELGTVDVGSTVEKRVAVSHAGRGDWRITDVKAVNPNFQVELFETARARGKVSYEVLFRLTPDAPVGFIRDQLLLETSDPQAPQIAVEVTGRVASAVTVSPTALFLGVVEPGQKVSKQLIVRSRKPFRITKIECDDKNLEVEASDEAKAVHLLPVKYTAGDREGKITEHITIATDQGDSVTECTAYAQVIKTGGASTPRTARDQKTRPATHNSGTSKVAPAPLPSDDAAVEEPLTALRTTTVRAATPSKTDRSQPSDPLPPGDDSTSGDQQ